MAAMRASVVVCALLVVSLQAAAAATWRPVVLMHGLVANASTLLNAKKWIEQDFPGIYVRSMEIGDGQSSSLLEYLPAQVEEFASKIQADPQLSRGFNLIGHSQGGLISRAYIERHNKPAVHNFITWATPHGGQYGVPQTDLPWLSKLFSDLLNGNLTSSIQHSFSFATYWKDPYNYARYLEVSEFLADINNERAVKNAAYKANMLSLNHFMMEYSSVDKVVTPPSSGMFESFAEGQGTVVVPLKQSAQYTQDFIGLRTLDQSGRLSVGRTDCMHKDFPHDNCKQWYIAYTRGLLNNTLA